MVRLIGAVLVAAGCAWGGFQAAEGMRRRARTLRELSSGLALVERELELTAPPLERLMAGVAARSQGVAGALFSDCARGMSHLDEEDLPSLWRRLVEERSGLGREEREILLPLGDLLGRYDSRTQGEAVAAVRRRLEELAGRVEAEGRRRGRVYQALGLSGGAFLVILLL